jgi:hypothetical protein
MQPEKYEELRIQVKGLIHSEMRLLETFLIKRVMLILEYLDELNREGSMELSSTNEKLSNSSRNKPL